MSGSDKRNEEPEESGNSDVRMSDVAAAAGVSVTTVSNVVNRPHLVAAVTREKVQKAVQELNFRPNLHAKALREEGAQRKKGGLGRNAPSPSLQEGVETAMDEAPLPSPTSSAPDFLRLGTPTPGSILKAGARVHLKVSKEGLPVRGVIDEVMPDGSCFWIWSDVGLGRRLVIAGDAVLLAVE